MIWTMILTVSLCFEKRQEKEGDFLWIVFVASKKVVYDNLFIIIVVLLLSLPYSLLTHVPVG